MPDVIQMPEPVAAGPKKRQKPRSVANLPLPTQRLLSMKQAGDYLGTSDKFVRKLVVDHEIPVIKGPGVTSPYLVDVEDLNQWISTNKTLA